MHIASAILDCFQEYIPYHALSVFSRGCNLRCSFCHNDDHLGNMTPHPQDIGRLQTWLPEVLTPMHEAIVFLGGEPTLHGESLMEALQYCKHLGLKTKVFTNAQHPVWVQQAGQRGLIDAWSFDVKCIENTSHILGLAPMPASRYLQRIQQCVKYAQYYGIPYELRTTLAPCVKPQQQAIEAFCLEHLGQRPRFQTYVPPKSVLAG